MSQAQGGSTANLDFRIPHPLMNPKAWPSVAAVQEATVDADFIDSIGGPFATYLEALQTHGVHLKHVRVRLRDVREVLTWVEETFVTANAAPEWSEQVLRFVREMPSVSERPWQELGYLPGFVRQAALDPRVARRAAMDWARFSALYSPQVDRPEKSHLVSLNPTAQFVSDAETGQPMVFWRVGEELCENKINWQQAWIFDELGEHIQMEPRQLMAALPPDPKHVRPKGETLCQSWVDVVDDLIRQNLVFGESLSFSL